MATTAMDLERRSSIQSLSRFNIAIVVPCYNVEHQIGAVLESIPRYVRHVIAVDDASRDTSFSVIEARAALDPRILPHRHEHNQGVGGAMVTGFRLAMDLGAQVVVKLDGDGQMDPRDLPKLILPLIRGDADYTKGNRFHDFHALARMPAARRIGNIGLSFLAKAATGYWNLFDPTNGFVGIRRDILERLPLHRMDRGYFFETSMLAELNFINALVRDVPMPARYADEVSNLSLRRVLVEFPPKLFALGVRRLVLKNFLYDFTIESVHLLFGVTLLLSGAIYGGWNWLRYLQLERGAPTGTVVISALLIILGVQLLLSAIDCDLRAVPTRPVNDGPLMTRGSAQPIIVDDVPVLDSEREERVPRWPEREVTA